MSPVRIPAYVIFGATGAGKTTVLKRMLARRPRGERWAVLVNDFGSASFDDAPGVAEGDVVVREVAGCICCTAQVALRTAVVALVREAKPDRLLIEASTAARPAAILRVLREPGIATAVETRTTLAAADAAQLSDARYADNEVYREQLAAADAIVLKARDGAADAGQRAARDALARLGCAEKSVLDATADVELGGL